VGRGKALVTATALICLLSGAALSTARVEKFNNRPYLHDNLYLPSGKFVEQASLGYKEMVADLVWFNAVQYYGGYRQAHHDLAYFEGLINIVTDLDPHFTFPYVFGAAVMSQDLERPDRAVALLKKGMVQNPTNGEFPFEIGFVSYIDAHDNKTAAHYFELASKFPDGGDKAKRFAAFVYSQGGHQEKSMRMWELLIEESDNPWMRELAERSLEKLRAEHREEAQRVDS